MSNAQKVSDERLAEYQRDCGMPNLPTQETYQFRQALHGEGPHAYDWSDKPHRLVFGLCRIIEEDAALRAAPTPDAHSEVGVKDIARIIAQLRSVANERVYAHMDQNAEDRIEWEAADILQALTAGVVKAEPVAITKETVEQDRARLIHILVVHYEMFREKAEEAAELFLHEKTLIAAALAPKPEGER